MDADELHRVALRMLADYDAGRPNEIFAERGTDWLTLDDAYAVQQAVAELRRGRGERSIGYKVGCVSPAIQNQFGLHQPVRGYVWESEAHISGCRLSPSRFSNLAIEGEIALRLRHDITTETASDADVWDCVECWFPVLELHNYVFRGTKPTSQELVAANALHAGFVAARFAESSVAAGAWPTGAEALASAEIRMEIDDQLVETARPAALQGGPLGSMRWLVSSLAQAAERLSAGQIVLTGSPGRLIPITESCVVRVACAGRQVELRTKKPLTSQ